MLYAFICVDNPASLDSRLKARPAHVERLQQLKKQGRLVLAGPHPAIDNAEPRNTGFTGSLIVAEFDNLTQAQEWADQDPYIDAGVYQSVTVKPFNRVLP